MKGVPILPGWGVHGTPLGTSPHGGFAPKACFAVWMDPTWPNSTACISTKAFLFQGGQPLAKFLLLGGDIHQNMEAPQQAIGRYS